MPDRAEAGRNIGRPVGDRWGNVFDLYTDVRLFRRSELATGSYVDDKAVSRGLHALLVTRPVRRIYVRIVVPEAVKTVDATADARPYGDDVRFCVAIR